MERYWLWEFTPSGDACGRCQGLAGLSRLKPTRPHLNCRCDIKRKPYLCSEPPTEVVMRLPAGTWGLRIGIVEPGGELSTTVTNTYTSSTKVSAGMKAGGLEVGVEASESEGQSSSVSTKHPHSGVCGGNEEVWAMYDQWQFIVLTHFDNCTEVLPGGRSGETWTSDEGFVSELSNYERECLD